MYPACVLTVFTPMNRARTVGPLPERRPPPKLPATARRLEEVLFHVVGDLLAEHGSLHVRGAEVDAAPHTGVDDPLERVREAVEAPGRTGRGRAFVADRREGDSVRAE